MFRFAKRREVLWPVTIDVPSDDGSGRVDEVCVRIRYRLLTQSELADRVREGLEAAGQIGNLEALLATLSPGALEKRLEDLREHITGWEDIGDEDGQQMPFSAEALDALLDVPYFRAAAEQGLLDASRGAPAKNSGPGSAISNPPTASDPGTAVNAAQPAATKLDA